VGELSWYRDGLQPGWPGFNSQKGQESSLLPHMTPCPMHAWGSAPFFFIKTVTGVAYLDTLENSAVSQASTTHHHISTPEPVKQREREREESASMMVPITVFILMTNSSIECCGLDWSGSGYVQVESSCECGNEPLGSIKCWELPNGCTTCGLLCGTRLHRVS
jgi:hypothetical protein